MVDQSRSGSGVLSLLSRYKKGFAWGTFVLLTYWIVTSVLLFKGVAELAPILSPHLIDAGLAPTTAELIAPVAIHVGFATVLLAFLSREVRVRFHTYGQSVPVLFPFPYYEWAKEFVDEQQLGGEDAEQWPETPPTRSGMIAALGVGAVVLIVGLLLLMAPVVGFVLAIAGHALSRHRGIRPVRPLSWHLALTTLLVPVATAFLTAFLHLDVAHEWFGVVGDSFLGLITNSQLPIAALPILAFSILVTQVLVTYIGMYYLLVAYDSWRVRMGWLPTATASSCPAPNE